MRNVPVRREIHLGGFWGVPRIEQDHRLDRLGGSERGIEPIDVALALHFVIAVTSVRSPLALSMSKGDAAFVVRQSHHERVQTGMICQANCELGYLAVGKEHVWADVLDQHDVGMSREGVRLAVRPASNELVLELVRQRLSARLLTTTGGCSSIRSWLPRYARARTMRYCPPNHFCESS
jgi:hypothetical protein